ncbi:MAG: hypothetical protein QOH38_163 [Thermoleophilaceae bacterium]|nr:hypothetical protein [Thermoleophilaceae bacterium]
MPRWWTDACGRLNEPPTRPKARQIGADHLSVTRRPSTSVLPGRFRIHGLDVEVEPVESGGWRGRVVAPALGAEWHHGRRAWDALDAAALAHLASAPSDETYLRLLASPAAEAAQLVAA